MSERDDARVGDDKAPPEPEFTRQIPGAIDRAGSKNDACAGLEIEAKQVK